MGLLKEITLSNSNGMELKVSNYGATIISLKVPDKNNQLVNVVVGLETAENYLEKPYTNQLVFLGSSIGRYAGRISKGNFQIEDENYPIYHDSGVHLHGGKEGFDVKYWKIEDEEKSSVTLSYFSKHLEEGYPGNLEAKVTYQLTESNELKVTYNAVTDKTTPVNLTNHSYFNLNGKDSVLSHKLQINSHSYLDVDELLIPTGKINKSENTRFNYSKKQTISNSNFIGLDDTFVLEKKENKAAEITSEATGITMEVYTNQPAMVVFTPKSFPELPFKDNAIYTEFSAICFETQNFPDAPNNRHFPNSLLKPNEEYINKTIFKFKVI